MKGKFYVLMDEAGGAVSAGGAVAGGGSGDAAPSAPAAPATAAPAQPAGTTAAPASVPPVNATGASTVPPAAPATDAGTALAQVAAPEQPYGIPEKYQVKKDDGTLDLEASTAKLAEGARHLEKRIGTGDLPPKTPEEYTINVPDALKDTWKPDEDPLLKEFTKAAHAKGFTQAQLDLALSTYMDIAPKLLAGDKALTADECTAELKKTWTDPAAYKTQMQYAYKTAKEYGGDDTKVLMQRLGNDPVAVRFLARIGAELGEDRSTPPGPGMPSGVSVESLQASEAYNNPKHADHARVSAQVSAHYAAAAKAAERAGQSPLM